MKRTLSLIAAILSWLTALAALQAFHDATTGVELAKQGFFMIVATIAGILFVRNVINNEWPWE